MKKPSPQTEVKKPIKKPTMRGKETNDVMITSSNRDEETDDVTIKSSN